MKRVLPVLILGVGLLQIALFPTPKDVSRINPFKTVEGCADLKDNQEQVTYRKCENFDDFRRKRKFLVIEEYEYSYEAEYVTVHTKRSIYSGQYIVPQRRLASPEPDFYRLKHDLKVLVSMESYLKPFSVTRPRQIGIDNYYTPSLTPDNPAYYDPSYKPSPYLYEKVALYQDKWHGGYHRYSSEGVLLESAKYEKGYLHGKRIFFYHTGGIEYLSNYRLGELEGILEYYNEAGYLISRKLYSDSDQILGYQTSR